jgi:hypothetical protein
VDNRQVHVHRLWVVAMQNDIGCHVGRCACSCFSCLTMIHCLPADRVRLP